MKLHFVDTMDEVLALALESPLPAPKAESEVIPAVPPSADVVSGQVARQ
jgi:ATP-dependent Lon protease